MIENGGNDLKYALLLKDLKSEIDDKLKDVSVIKSKQWGVDVKYDTDRFLECTLNKILHYKINRLCDSCEKSSSCRYFERIRRYFVQFGYIVVPYIVYTERISSKRIKPEQLSSFGSIVTKVLFVNSFCFWGDCEDDFVYSALNNAFHELFNTIPDDYMQRHIVPSIDKGSFIKFVSRTDMNNKLLVIYGKQELIPQNEAVIRYICNNEETKCLLEALVNEDNDFQPAEELRGLHRSLVRMMKELLR